MVAGSADDQVRRNVEKLLSIASAEELAMSLIERAALPGGRVESHEFGRDQHSSASAGAVLMGMAGVPSVSDHALMLHTDSARKIADRRHEFMMLFLDEFHAEWDVAEEAP
jgi:hypothetical protein